MPQANLPDFGMDEPTQCPTPKCDKKMYHSHYRNTQKPTPALGGCGAALLSDAIAVRLFHVLSLQRSSAWLKSVCVQLDRA
jgi:hypothetical protein